MSDTHSRMERLRQMRHDIRQPATEVLAPVEPVVSREAVGNHERRDCDRSKTWRRAGEPTAASGHAPDESGVTDAACPV